MLRLWCNMAFHRHFCEQLPKTVDVTNKFRFKRPRAKRNAMQTDSSHSDRKVLPSGSFAKGTEFISTTIPVITSPKIVSKSVLKQKKSSSKSRPEISNPLSDPECDVSSSLNEKQNQDMSLNIDENMLSNSETFKKNNSRKEINILPGFETELGVKLHKRKRGNVIEPLPNVSMDGITTDLIFGLYPVELALKSKRRTFHKLFYKENPNERVQNIIKTCEDFNIPTTLCKNSILSTLTSGCPHQGVVGLVTPLQLLDSSSLLCDAHKTDLKRLWLYLDGILDPMNFGSILRTAYFLGVDSVLVPSSSHAKLSAITSKASSGAMEIFPLHSVHSPSDFMNQLQDFNWDILGARESKQNLCTSFHNATEFQNGSISDQVLTNLKDSSYDMKRNIPTTDISNYSLTKSTVLVLGNEGVGISSDISGYISQWIKISPSSHDREVNIECLNVSVATAIILHKLLNKSY